MLSLLFTLMTSAYASPAPEVMFVSMYDERALVLANFEGRLNVLTCPIPRGPVPDLSFAAEGAFARCRTKFPGIEDTPSHRAEFSNEFVAVIRKQGARALTHSQIMQRYSLAAVSAAASSALGLTGAHLLAKRYSRALPKDSFRRFFALTTSLSALTAGTFIFTTDSKIANYQNVLAAEIARLDYSSGGPVMLKAGRRVFKLLEAYAGVALSRAAGPG